MPTLDAAGLTAVALPVQAQAHSLQYAEPLERSTELSDSQAADVSDERRNGTAQLAVDTGEELSDVEEQQANKRDKAKRPHLKGRFSGRLETKEDEKKVAEECKLLGPLVGGSGKRGERSRLTLAKIVRGIASGHVREFLEAREVENQNLRLQIKELQARLAGASQAGLANASPLQIAANNGGMPIIGAAVAAPQAQALTLAPSHVATTAVLPPAVETTPSQLPQNPDAELLMTGAAQLHAQAQNFAVHASQLQEQSATQDGQGGAVQKAVEAQSFQRKAMSLEAAANAQSLQAEAIMHAAAQAIATKRAHRLTVGANEYVNGGANAAKNPEISEAMGALAQSGGQITDALVVHQLTSEAHSMAEKAHRHAHFQAQAQMGAAQKAEQAHKLDEDAKQLQFQAKQASELMPANNSLNNIKYGMEEPNGKRSRLSVQEAGLLPHMAIMGQQPVTLTTALQNDTRPQYLGTEEMLQDRFQHQAMQESSMHHSLLSAMYPGERQVCLPMTSLPMRNF